MNLSEITKDTKITALLSEYPWIKDELLKVSDKFKLLDNPLAKAMLSKASIADLVEKTNLDTDELVAKFKQLIAEHKG